MAKQEPCVTRALIGYQDVDGTFIPITAATPLPGTGVGGGGGGDASAANQVLQIAQLPTSRGAKTGALSLSVVPNSDTAFPVTGTFWQATQPVSMAALTATAAADANRLPVDQRDGSTFTGSVTSATTIVTVDTVGYESITVQITSAGSATVIYECSDDNVTFSTVSGLNASAAGTTSGSYASTTTAVAMLNFPVKARYFRARVSAYTSGTVTVVGYLRKAPVTAFGAQSSVQGAAIHGASISGAPVRIGARAQTAALPAVTTGQTADLVSTAVGALTIKPYSIPEGEWAYAGASGGLTTTTSTQMAAAGGAGIRNYVTGVSLQNASATVATEVAILDGATVLWRGYLGTSALLNSAVGIVFPSPLRGSNNTAVNVQCGTTAAQVYVNAQGYIAP